MLFLPLSEPELGERGSTNVSRPSPLRCLELHWVWLLEDGWLAACDEYRTVTSLSRTSGETGALVCDLYGTGGMGKRKASCAGYAEAAGVVGHDMLGNSSSEEEALLSTEADMNLRKSGVERLVMRPARKAGWGGPGERSLILAYEVDAE